MGKLVLSNSTNSNSFAIVIKIIKTQTVSDLSIALLKLCMRDRLTCIRAGQFVWMLTTPCLF